MAIRTKEELRALFETGDRPTQENFYDLIDSLSNRQEIVIYNVNTDTLMRLFTINNDVPAVLQLISVNSVTSSTATISVLDNSGSNNTLWTKTLYAGDAPVYSLPIVNNVSIYVKGTFTLIYTKQ